MSKILIVDDEPRILLLMQNLLKANGYTVVTANDGAKALELVRGGGIDIAVTDLRMQPMDGMTLFKEIHQIAPDMPVILLTAYASVETAIEAMKLGIFDYMTKPFRVDDMVSCLKRAEEKVRKAATQATGIEHPLNYRFENLIANSDAMRNVCDMIQKVAPTAVTVLINGESGTGKEVIAKTIHRNSFETANGGTLFLDEVSSMPLMLQGKLLRALQEKEIRRVGGTKSIPVDVRVIAASNANLEEAVVKGTFRSDLYYRFAVITIDIPPLRKRVEDIVPLARHFIKEELHDGDGRRPVPEIAADAVRALESYDWPGNVRELENAIKHALTFHQGGDITVDLLPAKIIEHKGADSATNAGISDNASLKSYLKAKEKEYIEKILGDNGGDKEKTAEALKVNLSTLYRKLSEQ